MVESITAIPRRFGVWLGLLALALQLGLSIGHVHIGLDWGRAAGLTSAEPSIGPGDDRSPAGNPAAPAEDKCPICFALAVSRTFILTVALPVILALVFEAARLVVAPRPIPPARPHFSSIQQRAPPPVPIPA
jgi:O-antigen ligase